MAYITTPLTKQHDRETFSCGKEPLDRYLKKQAMQDMKRHLAVVFIAIEDASQKIKGYYSLSNDAISRDIVPETVQKKMPPHYSNLPVTLLGRLAVDREHQGQKLGEGLLLDALKRSYEISTTHIGSMAVVVDPIDNSAVDFYRAYGFILLPDRNRLFLPMKTIKTLFE